MPGCVIRVRGPAFDPDNFLVTSKLKPYSLWRRGQFLAEAGPRAARKYEDGGFQCDVSQADGDLQKQLIDAASFLVEYKSDLAMLSAEPEVMDIRLDFGISSRESDRVIVWSEYLSPAFLKLAADLNIGIQITVYPNSNV